MITRTQCRTKAAEGIWEQGKGACLSCPLGLPSLRTSDTIEIGPKPSSIKEWDTGRRLCTATTFTSGVLRGGPYAVGETRHAIVSSWRGDVN